MSDDLFSRILTAIEGLRSDTVADAGRLRSDLTNLVTDLRTDVNHKLAELRTDVTHEFGQLRGEMLQTRGDMMSRMDRLQDAITALRDDVTVNYERANRAEGVAQKGIEGMQSVYRHLSEEIAGMHRQIRRLQADVRTLRGEPS